jgi:hypothetical protein
VAEPWVVGNDSAAHQDVFGSHDDSQRTPVELIHLLITSPGGVVWFHMKVPSTRSTSTNLLEMAWFFLRAIIRFFMQSTTQHVQVINSLTVCGWCSPCIVLSFSNRFSASVLDAWMGALPYNLSWEHRLGPIACV